MWIMSALASCRARLEEKTWNVVYVDPQLKAAAPPVEGWKLSIDCAGADLR